MPLLDPMIVHFHIIIHTFISNPLCPALFSSASGNNLRTSTHPGNSAIIGYETAAGLFITLIGGLLSPVVGLSY